MSRSLLLLKGNTPTESFTVVKFWATKFKRGRMSFGDDESTGRPKTATTDDNIAKVHLMVLDERRSRVREIEEIMKISK